MNETRPYYVRTFNYQGSEGVESRDVCDARGWSVLRCVDAKTAQDAADALNDAHEAGMAAARRQMAERVLSI